MNKIVLCPGKIPIRNKEQPWYAPIDDNYPINCVICECCYKHYGKLLEPICFKVVYGEKYYCWCGLRTFDKSSVTINNIRVSVINPDNFFRYRLSKRKDKIHVHIPKDHKYIIIAENMDEGSDSKISVDEVSYSDIDVRYYDKKYPYYLIIDNEDYIAYNNLSNSEQNVNFIIKKWTKSTDPDMKSYYTLVNDDSYFEFQLIFGDNESKIMNSVIEINKNLSENTGKIILIDNFII